MSYTVIQRMIHSCQELAASFQQKNKSQISKWIKEIEEENQEELSFAQEWKIPFLLKLHGFVKQHLEIIKTRKQDMVFVSIEEILEKLKSVTNQSDVRDQIIKEIIHPIMKQLGWKKKGRSFIKKENGYSKKLLVYSSRSNDYYDVKFAFEMEVDGKGTNISGERISYDTSFGKRDRWYELTQDVDIENIKAQIQADLKGPIKKFFAKYK
jgi:hypothetical protein